MKEIVVLSGKGGTGKTAVTSSFAALAKDAVLADADVDAANLGLVLDARPVEEERFEGGHVAVLDESLCDDCGLCLEKCRFGAIDEGPRIDPLACEGCGLCAAMCHAEAIRMEPRICGRVTVAETRHGTLVHARLDPGAENSGKLVTRVRQRAREIAEERGASLLLTDGPPGIGCPVIASIGGADLALIVAEAGVSGVHDLDRVLDLATHFRVPAAVAVNRWDLSPENAERIESRCAARGVPFAGRIPFDRNVVDAIVAGIPPVLGADGPAARAIRQPIQSL